MKDKPRSLELIAEDISACRQCDRLVAWRERVGREKRRAYRLETYWSRPVPGFGDPNASLVIVGLAPGAHGANRTGRMFTGDRSGDFLYAALFRAGVASQPTSKYRDDGQALSGVFITAPCRCVPPENKPTVQELLTCRPWLIEELRCLPRARTYLALGKTGYDAVVALSRAHGDVAHVPAFAHGVGVELPDPAGRGERAWLFGSYHVSQQNTQTRKLTEAMFDEVLTAALTRARGA